MNVSRFGALAIALNNGKVLIAGGGQGFPVGTPIGGTELYDEVRSRHLRPLRRWAQ
ncbi:MAG: hypothetical protein ACLQAT_14700 [Candidatus Binataceae bacterium]